MMAMLIGLDPVTPIVGIAAIWWFLDWMYPYRDRSFNRRYFSGGADRSSNHPTVARAVVGGLRWPRRVLIFPSAITGRSYR